MKKIWIVIIFVTLFACGGEQVKSQKPNDNSLVILHVNDTHSHIEGEEDATGETIGGFAKMKGFINQTRNEMKNILVLHAGDILTGNIYSSIYHGEFNVELMNMMGFDACAIGNHEFDYGLSNFLKLKDMAEFPFVSANVMLNGELLTTPYIITNMGEYSAVILGLTTSDMGVINTEVRDMITIENEAVALSNYIYEMKLSETNEIFICLTHSGIEADRKLAKLFPEIDVIVGGHSHTEGWEQIDSVIISSAGSDAEKVGYIELTWNPELKEYVEESTRATNRYKSISIKQVDLDVVVPSDQAIADLIAEKADAIEESMDVFMGISDYYFDNSELRNEPVPLGNLMADILHQYVNAEVVILNAGSIRNELPSGDITLRDLYELYPFDNELVIAELEGSYLIEIAEQGVESLGAGAFLYYSDGFRVDSMGDETVVTLNGEPIQENMEYTVAVSDYVFEGGDNYIQFENATDVYYTGWNIRDLIIQYIEEYQMIDDTIYDDEPRVLLPDYSE